MKKAQEEERTKYESQLREQTNTLEQYEEVQFVNKKWAVNTQH